MTDNQDKKDNGKRDDNEDKEKEAKPQPQDRTVTTKHSLKIKGKDLKYTATVGTVVLKEEDEREGHKPRAEMFFIAFNREGVRNRAKRPIMFSFNGGPGSSSVWMLLGLLGPRRVPLSEDDTGRVEPPFQLMNNENTLLEEADLVFIDPVGTGYSRPLVEEKDDPDEYFSFKRDIESVGEFIRLYTSRNERWSSPKFLIGESYGTTRASGLSGHLQDRYGLYLNGVVLVSAVLNFQTLMFNPGNDLPYVLYLPSYALAARYHGKLSRKYRDMTQDAFLDEVRKFAEEEYNLALTKGDRLPAGDRERIVKRLATYTGLDEHYIEGSNLRVPIMRFAKELLRREGKVIGRFDSRITGVDKDDVSEHFERDPSFDVVQGVYSACLNDYVRTELKFESDLPYEILSFKILPKWKYENFQNSYVNTAETLRQAMTKNPHLKVFVANGLYDLATPLFATEYTVDHLGLRDGLQSNVQMGYYSAGHMMYSHKDSLAAMTRDLKRFIKQAF